MIRFFQTRDKYNAVNTIRNMESMFMYILVLLVEWFPVKKIIDCVKTSLMIKFGLFLTVQFFPFVLIANTAVKF